MIRRRQGLREFQRARTRRCLVSCSLEGEIQDSDGSTRGTTRTTTASNRASHPEGESAPRHFCFILMLGGQLRCWGCGRDGKHTAALVDSAARPVAAAEQAARRTAPGGDSSGQRRYARHGNPGWPRRAEQGSCGWLPLLPFLLFLLFPGQQLRLWLAVTSSDRSPLHILAYTRMRSRFQSPVSRENAAIGSSLFGAMLPSYTWRVRVRQHHSIRAARRDMGILAGDRTVSELWLSCLSTQSSGVWGGGPGVIRQAAPAYAGSVMLPKGTSVASRLRQPISELIAGSEAARRPCLRRQLRGKETSG